MCCAYVNLHQDKKGSPTKNCFYLLQKFLENKFFLQKIFSKFNFFYTENPFWKQQPKWFLPIVSQRYKITKKKCFSRKKFILKFLITNWWGILIVTFLFLFSKLIEKIKYKFICMCVCMYIVAALQYLPIAFDS